MSSNYDGTSGITGSIVTGEKIDRIGLWHGIGAPPTAGSNDVPSNGLYLNTTTGIIYENTNTLASPTWVARTVLGIDHLGYLKLSTTIGDYSSPSAAVVSSAPVIAADMTDDCSSDNWVDAGADGISGGVLSWNAVRDGINKSCARDVTSMSDTQFEYRHKLVISAVTTGLESMYAFFGVSSASQASDINVAQDAIGLILENTFGGSKKFRAVAANGAELSSGTVNSDFSTPLAVGTYYLKIRRLSETSTTIGLYVDALYTELIEEETLTITSGYTGLRYWSYKMFNGVASGGALNGTCDDFSIWKTTNGTPSGANAIDNNTGTAWTSNSEANPKIYVDLTSIREIVGLALNINKTDTTVTSLKIRASTDTTFTDGENIAYVNISDFTDDTWRFLANNWLADNRRYVQIYANETGILSLNEIKVRYGVSDAVKLLLHKHRTRTVDGVDSFTDSN